MVLPAPAGVQIREFRGVYMREFRGGVNTRVSKPLVRLSAQLGELLLPTREAPPLGRKILLHTCLFEACSPFDWRGQAKIGVLRLFSVARGQSRPPQKGQGQSSSTYASLCIIWAEGHVSARVVYSPVDDRLIMLPPFLPSVILSWGRPMRGAEFLKNVLRLAVTVVFCGPLIDRKSVV